MREVDDPGVPDNKHDAVIIAEHRLALATANGRIRNGRECMKRVREHFAAGGS